VVLKNLEGGPHENGSNHSEQELLNAVRQAVTRDSVAHTEHAELASIRQRYEKLTPREKEVMALVVQGLLNKQIALKLSASEATI